MYLNIKKEQFEFQQLNNGFLFVTFKPVMTRKDTKKFFCLFTSGNRYFDLAFNVMKSNCNWVELNYLAQFVQDYNNQIITSI